MSIPPRSDLLSDKVVLVSGGTQGVGAAIARAAAAEGASVVLTGRRPELGALATAQLRDRGAADAVYIAADVGDVASAQASIAETVARFGRIDGLVNAAGLTDRGSLLDTDPGLFDRMIAVNLRGPFFLMQAAVADMVRRGEPGSIVNITSISALGGQPYLAPYVASKAGLTGLTKNVAHAHRWDRIRVNALNIGWTETEGEDAVQRNFHAADDGWLEEAGARLPMGRLIQVDEVAAMAVLLLSDRSGVVTGSVIDWDQHVPGGSE